MTITRAHTKERIMNFTDLVSTSIVFTIGVYVAFICFIYIVQFTCNWLPNNICTIAHGDDIVLLVVVLLYFCMGYIVPSLLVIMVVILTLQILFTKNTQTSPILPLHHKIT